MNRYTIYCTESQTKKALELSAPINVSFQFNNPTAIINNIAYEIPTAERIIGWLEEQGDIKSINVECAYKWHYEIYNKEYWKIMKHNDIYNSRKEATLAAIDAALDYLIKNRK